MHRIVLAMSGGVDSSVAAHLLLKQGHEVIGVFMRHGEPEMACDSSLAETVSAGDVSTSTLPILHTTPSRSKGRPGHKQGCCSAADAEDGRRVADKLNIPYYALDLREDFDRIIDYFVDEYVSGRTPNPCVMCNNWLKFGKLFDYAESVGADFVATGHYARLTRDDPRDSHNTVALWRGRDPSKDQSYVLFGVDRDYLPKMLLPVGDYQKPQIRAIAAELGMNVAQKRDSQEICFVTSGKHDQFIRRRRPEDDRSGEIVTTGGRVVGEHDGIEGFTIGQRKGLGVAMGEPYYVVRIEAESRQVVIGQKGELAQKKLTADRLNWLVDPPGEEFSCLAQIRYNSTAAAGAVKLLDTDRIEVVFDEPRYGVSPGQAVVLYEGDRVLGGGWIE